MPNFRYPEQPVDGLLRRAALRDPAACAVRTPHGMRTFAELDARADRYAAYLEHTLGRRGARVGIAGTLDEEFPAAWYGILRSGNTAVLLNPLVRSAGLRHMCEDARVETAFVPTATAELLVKAADRLPLLRAVVVTDAPDGIVPADAVPLCVALDSAPRPAPRAAEAFDPDTEACVQFTTGTTGRPKGVRLTHRNLVANAAQTAAAHHLDAGAVTLNNLPVYFPMHLNSAVYAGACQVLCPCPRPTAALELADRAGATHLYTLPARLHQLAADVRFAEGPRGDGLPHPVPGRPGRLTVVLSGGSALAPADALLLAERLGVPVLQGYGLVELSPLTHSQRPDGRTGTGTVGAPVPGTECRVVHPETGAPLGPRETGQVQVRGPQLMAGYLGESGPPVDADGWFSTGDAGRIGPDGELHLADRLDDVYSYDSELVSPTAVEAVLAADARVEDCVAVGWPDPVHGALTWLGIVLADPAAPGLLDVLDSIVETANEQLAPHERIRRVEVLDAVPRTPAGKPERRSLRRALRLRAAAEAAV
ncbi:class I adenylate-forming enzyme family protein [Streptomyces lavendulae]|uniref:class I adenylate-forming enzyme family protein n=1 Tax=Streptomyces lavendulae TaxID=1914 RepID=UPI0024A06B33|nr:class I adenylate-forming enzyme family protein [Streptomyces lavendulae]GLX23076.1 AMP-dependent synthetase [Streptomyces lavendulae subsp. lavendulae]GLX30538.1 AMP-dependent synthetase [Streptomyces lavendulae subsp. lavendulae]